jgi:hypothetical protein
VVDLNQALTAEFGRPAREFAIVLERRWAVIKNASRQHWTNGVIEDPLTG